MWRTLHEFLPNCWRSSGHSTSCVLALGNADSKFSFVSVGNSEDYREQIIYYSVGVIG